MSLIKLAGNAYKDIAKTPSETEWPKQHPSIIIKIKIGIGVKLKNSRWRFNVRLAELILLNRLLELLNKPRWDPVKDLMIIKITS